MIAIDREVVAGHVPEGAERNSETKSEPDGSFLAMSYAGGGSARHL